MSWEEWHFSTYLKAVSEPCWPSVKWGEDHAFFTVVKGFRWEPVQYTRPSPWPVVGTPVSPFPSLLRAICFNAGRASVYSNGQVVPVLPTSKGCSCIH